MRPVPASVSRREFLSSAAGISAALLGPHGTTAEAMTTQDAALQRKLAEDPMRP